MTVQPAVISKLGLANTEFKFSFISLLVVISRPMVNGHLANSPMISRSSDDQ